MFQEIRPAVICPQENIPRKLTLQGYIFAKNIYIYICRPSFRDFAFPLITGHRIGYKFQWRKFRSPLPPPSVKWALCQKFSVLSEFRKQLNIQKFRKSYWSERLFIDLIIFRMFSSSMLVVLLCTLGSLDARSIQILSGSIFENR